MKVIVLNTFQKFWTISSLYYLVSQEDLLHEGMSKHQSMFLTPCFCHYKHILFASSTRKKKSINKVNPVKSQWIQPQKYKHLKIKFLDWNISSGRLCRITLWASTSCQSSLTKVRSAYWWYVKETYLENLVNITTLKIPHGVNTNESTFSGIRIINF